MIDYDMCVCYGVMISDEVKEQLCRYWSGDYYEAYVRDVNAWTNSEGTFFGLTKSITNSVLPLNDIDIPKYKRDKFEELIYKEKLEQLVNWNPKYYIINFCY